MTDERSMGRSDDEGRERDVTALVVLRPEPSDVAVDLVTDEFRRMGFDVGPFIGIAMAVTAPIGHLEEALDVSIPASAGESGDDDIDLPLTSLDPAVARHIDRIVIEPPAELHDETTGPTWT